MALGTPTSATVAYSASGGTSVSPAYPTGLVAGDVIVMFVGQKPSTANGGTVTTPAGWTLQDELLAAGGYGTTLGADTGNTNLRVYTKDTVTGAETGNLTVTVGGSNVVWAFMIHVPTGAGAISYGTADGQRTTTPTSPMSIALTNGATATDFEAGDLALWAMCIPTDVTTPSQFSAESITATGATFGTAVELREPDSATGNDIGGYSAYAFVDSGSSTTAPTVTTSVAGTLTNVRGPVVLLRVREAAVPSQDLTPSLYTNTNTFYGPTVTQFAPSQSLTPARYDNTNTIYSATVAPGAINLAPSRYDNANAFYSATVTQLGGPQTLNPALYTNTSTFYAASVTATRQLTPSRYDNANTFYSASVSATKALSPSRYDNSVIFYSATISQQSDGKTLLPSLYVNESTFYSASVSATKSLSPSLYNNTNAFYSPSISSTYGIAPSLYNNQNTFYSPTITATAYSITFPDYVASGYVDANYVGLAVQNATVFYSPALIYDQTLSASTVASTTSFFSPTVTKTGQAVHAAGVVKKRPFKPSKLIEPLDDASQDGVATVSAFKINISLDKISAIGETVIGATATIRHQTIISEDFSVRAFSSWNDPTDDELIAIFELIA